MFPYVKFERLQIPRPLASSAIAAYLVTRYCLVMIFKCYSEYRIIIRITCFIKD